MAPEPLKASTLRFGFSFVRGYSEASNVVIELVSRSKSLVLASADASGVGL